jgi:6-phosphogluconolactonase (cycloisomerase 2 family)
MRDLGVSIVRVFRTASAKTSKKLTCLRLHIFPSRSTERRHKVIRSFKVAMLFGIAVSVPSAFAQGGDDLKDACACDQSEGAVFTLSNDPSANAVVAFHRARDGRLQRAGSFATRGRGSSDGLGSQGALVLSPDGELLFAVDAGSNEISSFAVSGAKLSSVSHVASGGERPISLTVHGHLLYVLNAGGDGNITGFFVDEDGGLAEIKGSTRSLSGSAVGPAQIQFTPDGDRLVVTEKATNLIDIYNVAEDGRAEGPQVNASIGETPFGFAFGRRGLLVISEAFNGAKGAGALSSYRSDEGGLIAVSPSVPDHQAAPCWVAITGDKRTAFTTNTGSDTISAYRIHRDGRLELLDDDGLAATTGKGSKPIDMALSHGSRFLFALDSGTASISAFRVRRDGGLETLRGAGDLPPNAVGLAAR